MKKAEIISFHPGRQHNFEQAYQLSKHFSGFKHLTSLFISDKWVQRAAKISARAGKALRKRSAAVDGRFVDTNPLPELNLLLKRERGHDLTGKAYQERNEVFQKWILKKYAPPKVCIGYDTSSWVVFEAWKNKSLLVLDLSIAIPQYKLKLAKEFSVRKDMLEKLTQGDELTYDVYEKEINLADIILCGSEFVKASCISEGIDPAKIIVLPYGADLDRFKPNEPKEYNADRVKIVFVGNFGYRKGADIVLKAWENLRNKYPNAELHIFGGVQVEVPQQQERLFFHGFISQDSLIQELQSAQISILPTFFEGSSLAIYQSMAMGLAVITTPNAGSVIDHEMNGLIIPYGSVTALEESLGALLQDAGLRKHLGAQAKTSIQKYTWENYGVKLEAILNDAIKTNSGPLTSVEIKNRSRVNL